MRDDEENAGGNFCWSGNDDLVLWNFLDNLLEVSFCNMANFVSPARKCLNKDFYPLSVYLFPAIQIQTAIDSFKRTTRVTCE